MRRSRLIAVALLIPVVVVLVHYLQVWAATPPALARTSDFAGTYVAATLWHTGRGANLYDENAVLLPKSEEPVIGKAAIGEYYEKLFANPQFVPFTLTIDWNSFRAVGDTAIATSVFEGDVTRNGKQIHFRGKNLLVWKKQADGSWKIFRYMYDEIPAKK